MMITLYGADWCGDCRRAKAWFEANGIAYDYVDLIEHPDEVERVLERNNGVQKIPVIVFADDSHLVEPTNDELAAKMDELAAGQKADPAVVENTHLGRFELLRNGDVVSFASYRSEPNRADSTTVDSNPADPNDGDPNTAAAAKNVIVPHVETDPAHRGNGYAAELMEGVLAILRDTGRTITPLCPFAADHIRQNEQHHDLLAS